MLLIILKATILKNRILLNGLGRIGKAILRIALRDKSLEIVAINELNKNIKNIAYCLNYDSTYGTIEDKFEAHKSYIKNNDTKIEILNYSNLEDIDFEGRNIDIVIDASGSKNEITTLKKLYPKLIFLTHPNKDADINMVLGINDQLFDFEKHKVISTSSCNATALLPVFKLIDDNYKVASADVTTIHPLLSHQKTLDCQCIGDQNRDINCNFEFGRSATQNIIPSKTTTVKAANLVYPLIDSSFISSNSFRVPTSVVGAINIVLNINKNTTKDELVERFIDYEKNQTTKLIYNNFEPLVSSDFKGIEFASIVDHRFSEVINFNMIKLVIWYDNERGYSSSVVELIKNILKRKNYAV